MVIPVFQSSIPDFEFDICTGAVFFEPFSFGVKAGSDRDFILIERNYISLGIAAFGSVIDYPDGRHAQRLEAAAILVIINAEAVVQVPGDKNHVFVSFKNLADLVALYAYRAAPFAVAAPGHGQAVGPFEGLVIENEGGLPLLFGFRNFFFKPFALS